MEQHGLVGAVHHDVVDHVVGDDDVGRPLNRYAPTRSLRGDVVSGAHHEERRLVAVEGLGDALTRDVGVAVLGMRHG